MKVTVSFLKNQNACESGINKFEAIFDKQAELKDIIQYGIKSKNKGDLQDCNWLIVRKMSHKQKIQYAIYAAEQVINFYEKKYPNDDRPRKAIEAAKQNNKKNLANAVADAANAANAAYAANAADAANAANAAIAAAYATDAADADYAAANAAYAANAANAAYAANATYAAANAAANAAYTADAVNEANAAAYAAYASDAAYAAANASDAVAYAAWIKIGTKILEYGLKLIYTNKK